MVISILVAYAVNSEFARLSSGKEISRPRKRKNVINDEHQSAFKNQLTIGNVTPWKYLEAISNTIGKSK